ncbi:MAG: branched-chain alpha-keto acid dehydrogenase subunit E2 [Candidatus Neomarinimicrobiota bacterium]|nr:MAG: branched-chain alpha-keto acid dehydrogenase subunit E2 [Candidatus Neomarinimicrobiota bacterium]
MIKTITLPDLGEGITEVDISEILVAPGDAVHREDTLLVLESEKASMEIPSDYAGTVTAVHVAAGDTVQPGSPILDLDIGDSAEVTEAEGEPTLPAESSAPPATTPAAVVPPGPTVHASPSVRRLARELNIDITTVPRTGPKGRLTRDDLLNFIRDRMERPRPVEPEIDFSQWGPIEEFPLTKIRRLTGSRMQAAWQTIPQVTQFDQADITELDALRLRMKAAWSRQDVRITLLPFLMKAVAQLLNEWPDFNASLHPSGETLIRKQYYHLGIAVDTPAGLVVPVVKDVDRKDVVELSRELMDVSSRAREKKLTPAELQGATFTISSLGGIGGTYFSPIVNPPQVAILGVSRSRRQPVWQETEERFVPRLILPFSLSYDHRVIDGAAGARFTAGLSRLLADPDLIASWEVMP